jgi:peptidoglycan/xylan/chitin deacetylase (PgdA/CDA1 family)
MKKLLKKNIKLLLYFLSDIFPLKSLQYHSRRELLVINYHSIKGIDPDPIINRDVYRTESELEKDIVFLKKHYQFVTYKDVVDYVRIQKKIPSGSVFLTFDDGLRVVYTHIYPILKKHNVNAAFFLNPAFVDNKDVHFQRKKNLLSQLVTQNQIESKKREWKLIFDSVFIHNLNFYQSLAMVDYKKSDILNDLIKLFNIDIKDYLTTQQIYLNKGEIEEMIQDGFAFGGHSIDHPKYEELNIEGQVIQTVDSIMWVKNNFDLDYSIFAFPQRDHKITKQVFKNIEAKCDVSFGVQGVGDDEVPFHLQRIDAESASVKMSMVLKLEYIKFILRKLSGKKQFKRV